MRYASIDIGTNTLRLLIAEPSADRGLKPVLYKRAITRLGGSYTEENGISREAMRRTIEVLEDFRKEIDSNGVSKVLAFATSVVRRAKNSAAFRKEVFDRTGIDITVITGDEEARLSLLGVLSVIKDESPRKLVIDIGGGSTEFIFTDEKGVVGEWSMEMGVVHLTERHLKSDPPGAKEVAALEGEIRSIIGELRKRASRAGVDLERYSGKDGAVFIGTAGTITTLAALDQDLAVYDRSRINNYVLKKANIERMYKGLLSMSIKEREQVLSLEKGREDLIIPGSAVTLLTMEAFAFSSLIVSDAGLLEGMILNEIIRPS
ncbi:MAG: Ppx/GppA family phosphatase [Deltaproteobacteria bacterium]|nr:Ppx/GppA family phosphatase [Deltaproteobacteria bacterium]